MSYMKALLLTGQGLQAYTPYKQKVAAMRFVKRFLNDFYLNEL